MNGSEVSSRRGGTLPAFFVGNLPARAISTYAPEDRPYRIAVDGQLVFGMNAAAQTLYLTFASPEGADSVLPTVQEQIPTAAVVRLEASDVV